MEMICTMNRHDDAWPDNINTAPLLEIKQGCFASDVYTLICDRKNILHVKVCKDLRSRQEIGNLPPNHRLGNDPEPDRVPQITRANPQAAIRIENPDTIRIENGIVEWMPATTPEQNTLFNDLPPMVQEALQEARRPTLAQVNEMARGQWRLGDINQDMDHYFGG